jgi:heat shock protein HslJ
MWRSLWLIPLAFSLAAQAPTQRTVTVTGTLNHVMAIGGETTGWALQGDSGFGIPGMLLNEVEVAYPNQAKLREWNGKRVRVTGKLVKRRGVERGERTVLEVVKIEGAPPMNPLAFQKWVLVELSGLSLPASLQPTLEFRGAGGVAGGTSCNKFSGVVEVDGEKIKLGPMRMTRKACASEVMRIEEMYMKALGEAEKWEMQGGRLLLHASGAEKPLAFEKR